MASEWPRLALPMRGSCLAESMGAMSMPVETREMYSSPNGDRWFLGCDHDSERVFNKHKANAPSGGQALTIPGIKPNLPLRNGPGRAPRPKRPERYPSASAQRE
jgi:hypothetical protein